MLPDPQSPFPSRNWDLSERAAGVYFFVLLAMLTRLLAGWSAVRRLLRSARLTEVPGVLESDCVAIPLTAGVLHPAVLLPSCWREWPEGKVRAVLAHEFAHVSRRDTLVGLVARVNRCVFWFHPLAWWLERRLASVAEEACDDAGVRTLGESRQYAEVLIDIAQSAAASGRRISWQGMGVDGTGSLGARIDRVLGGSTLVRITRRQKWTVACACIATIAVVAACRQAAEHAPAKAQAVSSQARPASTQLAQKMTPEEIAQAELAVGKNPEDLNTRNRLIAAWRDSRETQELAAPHEIWLAEHHPEQETAWTWAKMLSTPSFARMKTIWRANADREDATTQVVSNAAMFFQSQAQDLPKAEQILLRLYSRDHNSEWARRLGSVYGSVLLQPSSNAQFAEDTRTKLAVSQDSAVLAATGLYIEQRAGLRPKGNPAVAKLADGYLQRALRLDSTSPEVQRAYEIRRIASHYARMAQLLGELDISRIGEQYAHLKNLSEGDQFEFLPDLAQRAYSQGETSDYNNDPATAARFMKLARAYALELRGMCARHSGEPGYGIAVQRANMILAGTALRLHEDVASALKYLAAASIAPHPSDNSISSTQRVLASMLHFGRPEARKAVLEYCERQSQILGPNDPAGFTKLAQQLRRA